MFLLVIVFHMGVGAGVVVVVDPHLVRPSKPAPLEKQTVNWGTPQVKNDPYVMLCPNVCECMTVGHYLC